MKSLKIIVAGVVLLATISIQAQISVGVNLGKPPLWGPAGYSKVDYYYLPDVQSYYDVRATKFIYLNNGTWIRSGHLPSAYRNYNLYNGYKVVLTDYHGSKPYAHFKSHKAKYYKGYKGKPQKNIGNNNGNHSGNQKNSGNNGNKGNNGKGNGKH
jgi:hypothetical protein